MTAKSYLWTLCLCLVSITNGALAQSNAKEVITKMPDFPGGITALMGYIYTNLQYPEQAILNEEEGTVIASFTVGVDGGITDIKITDCGTENQDFIEEARRLVASMPAWVPGESATGKSPCGINLPIRFRLGAKGKDQQKKLLKRSGKKGKEAVQTAQSEIPTEIFYRQQNGSFIPVELDQKPQYNGGEQEKFETMYLNIRYPQEARTKGVQGKVIVSVLLGESGQILETSITQGIGFGCDEESLKVVNLLAKKGFTPAIKDGVPLAVKFDIPIVFSIN